ncbi:hypothetical protein BJV77DRAFT_1066342 [Russula vinacea]|nr:hypothetical protein BJV77DRAFT_1066342 [Russula vinacea]
MRLTAAINLPVLLLALAVGSFALPKDTGQNPTPDSIDPGPDFEPDFGDGGDLGGDGGMNF